MGVLSPTNFAAALQLYNKLRSSVNLCNQLIAIIKSKAAAQRNM